MRLCVDDVARPRRSCRRGYGCREASKKAGSGPDSGFVTAFNSERCRRAIAAERVVS